MITEESKNTHFHCGPMAEITAGRISKYSKKNYLENNNE